MIKKGERYCENRKSEIESLLDTVWQKYSDNRENINIEQIHHNLGKYFAEIRNKGESEIFVFEKAINEKSWIGKWKDSLTLI